MDIPGDLELRVFQESDAADVLQIVSEPSCVESILAHPLHSQTDVLNWLNGLGSHHFKLVAVRSNAVVGIGILYLLPGEPQRHVGRISLFVHHDHRNIGVGHSMLHGLIGLADRIARLRRVELNVLCHNLKAIGLYQRFGFLIEGLHQDFACVGGRFLPAYTMARITHSP